MARRGKKYNKALELINPEMEYSIAEAVELLQKTNTVKFDPTVEVHFNLNLDPKHRDQIIRTTISLPHGTGKSVRILALSEKVSVDAMKQAGATIAGGEDIIEDIAAGRQTLDFDVVVAESSMMRHMGKIARILGPKGLMPNPKTGTVGENVEIMIKEIAGWRLEFKTDKAWNVHSVFGKLSFGWASLEQNLQTFIQKIRDVKPSWAKAKYINAIYVCNAMGPSIKIDINA